MLQQIFEKRSRTNHDYWIAGIPLGSASTHIDAIEAFASKLRLDIDDDMYVYVYDEKNPSSLTKSIDLYEAYKIRRKDTKVMVKFYGKWQVGKGLAVKESIKWERRYDLEVGFVNGGHNP